MLKRRNDNIGNIKNVSRLATFCIGITFHFQVFSRLAEQKGMHEKASVMEKYDFTKQEKRTLENSLTELCNRLKTISQKNLATNIPAASTVPQTVSDTVSNTSTYMNNE